MYIYIIICTYCKSKRLKIYGLGTEMFLNEKLNTKTYSHAGRHVTLLGHTILNTAGRHVTLLGHTILNTQLSTLV
jgi:hypothetical protein